MGSVELDSVLILAMFAVGCFCFVLLYGAPFLPTLKPQITAALDLLDLQPGQTMLELGCGDGRVLIAAAERGLSAVGYELNPILAVIAWARTRRYGSRVKVVMGDYWRVQWPPAEGVFAFILSRYMQKLDKKLVQYPHKPVNLASFAFEIPGRKLVIEKQCVFLYTYSSL